MKHILVTGKAFVKAFENLFVPHSGAHVLFYNVKNNVISFYHSSTKYGLCEIVMNDSIRYFNKLSEKYEFIVESIDNDTTLNIIVR